MATISGFGFGGTDHLNTLFEGYTNEFFARRAAQDSLENQQAYDIWSAKKLYPVQLQSQLDNYGIERRLSSLRTGDHYKNVRHGLEAAGYNPLLAVDGGGGFGGGSGPILSMSSGRAAPTSASGVSSGGASASGNPYMIASARQELQIQRKQSELLDAQIKQVQSNTAETLARTDKINEETVTERWKNPLKVGGRIWEAAGREDAKIGSVKDLAERMVNYFRRNNGSRNSASTLNRQVREFYPNTPRSTMFFLK